MAAPSPRRGSEHRYQFRIFALDAPLNLDPGSSKGDVEREMRGHILARGELLGRFQRWREYRVFPIRARTL